MTKEEFLKKICLLKVDGQETYLSFNTGIDERLATYFVIVWKSYQTYKDGKYIYGTVRITGPEWEGGIRDLSQLEERIKIAQKEMYETFLKEFPNQEEEFVFVEGEKEDG